MKILKKGKVEKRVSVREWKMIITCQKDDEHDNDDGCGAKLCVCFKDLFLRYFYGTHFWHYYTSVRCPQCGKCVRVWDVPEPVLEKVFTPRNKEQADFDGWSDN